MSSEQILNRVVGTEFKRQWALASPLQMAFNDDVTRLYVVAMGSNKIGVLSVADIEHNTLDPTAQIHVALSAGGPTGIVMDPVRGQANVTTRYDNGVLVTDLKH